MENLNKVQQEKALKRLKSSFDMYEKTKSETIKNMKKAENKDGTKKYTQSDIDDQIQLIKNAQDGIVEEYEMFGGNKEDLLKKTKNSQRKTNDKSNFNETSITLLDMMENMKEDREKELSSSISATATKLEQEYIPAKGEYSPEAAFDVIPLPSKGEGYKDKIQKASVAYLTAYDENMIVAPNLYKNKLILDYLLQEKLLSKEIDPIDLLEGDREAIILFLRASGYGPEYPITATDNITGKEFEAVVDLSKLKYKDFNLKGDSNGWFSFVLPLSKKEIKFRFPTHRDTLLLEKLNDMEEAKIKKNTITEYADTLNTFIEADEKINKDEKIKIRKAIREIENWGESIENDEGIKFNHALTNKLNLLVMAVDGITDKKYISNFIKSMKVKDSMELRKYIQNNEPGVDYRITVNRPESLGGGSFETFLQLDQFLFLNIAN